ncbi:MAG: M28 family peptidase [Acidobacteria bacterium]|nr:M28 family peptidase [Acidobacteriota bacterium]
MDNGIARVVLFVACGSVAAPCAPAAGPASTLVRVQRRGQDDLTVLRSAGFPVVHESLRSLFLEGSGTLVESLRDGGWAPEVLDFDADNADYLQVGLRPDSDQAAVFALGKEVWREENWVLVRARRGTPIDVLHEARVFVSRLPHRPLDIPRATPPLRGTLGGPDPLIQKMVRAVKGTDINTYWNKLVYNQPTGTRYSKSQGARDATAYCRAQLEAVGVPAEYQDYNSNHAPNVIGTHAGGITPEHVYIVIGHVDDLPSSGKAPGADDNASGAVTVLASARALSCFAFRSTVKFIACTGEEQGLLGSDAYAADAKARGEDIRGVIDLDMTGWEGDGSPDPEDLDLVCNSASMDLGQLMAQCAIDYGLVFPVNYVLCPSDTGSDHASFWRRGYKAVFGITDDEGYCGLPGNYPYYHQSSDTIAHCGARNFFHATIRTTVATLATLAEPFKVAFAQPTVTCDSSIRAVVGDRDPNVDPETTEMVAVTAWSQLEPAPETIALLEQGPDSMFFAAQVPTTSGPPIHGDGLVSVGPGDTLELRYEDALDCDGSANVPYTAGAPVECTGTAPAEVTGLQLARIDLSAHVEWPAVAGAHGYDVAGGLVSQLLSAGGFAAAGCLADDATATAWDDARPGPDAADAFYYLVRAENPFGPGTYGAGSDGVARPIGACP